MNIKLVMQYASLVLLLPSLFAHAESDSSHLADFDKSLPNNTASCIVEFDSPDGVISANNGWYHKHFYGNITVLDLYINNYAARKEITLSTVGYSPNRQTALYRSDWWNTNVAASWRFTTTDNRDNIWIALKGTYPANKYRIDVKMNEKTYSAFVRVDACPR